VINQQYILNHRYKIKLKQDIVAPDSILLCVSAVDNRGSFAHKHFDSKREETMDIGLPPGFLVDLRKWII